MKIPSENHSGDVNKDSNPTGFSVPHPAGIPIHIAPESVFIIFRNAYSHAPEFAFLAGAAFFAADFCCCALAAFAKRHRFFVAAIILAIPSLLIRRLGLGASCGAGSVAFLASAHLLRWASAIAFLPAALIFRRLRVDGSGLAADSAGPPGRMARSSAIFWSIRAFCDS
jgi:hypothetical protein